MFLKICELEPVARSELRRHFNEMTAAERDAILARLVALKRISRA